MPNPPENVKYALVKRRPSAWRQGVKLAAIMAVLQVVLSASQGEPLDYIVFVTVLVFFGYWIFFAFLVWLWRAIRGK
jgi:hypothetical protein